MVNRTPIRALRRGRLTHAQWMWLLYGWDEKWADAFRDKTDYEECWAHHREELLASYRNSRRRPVAWWICESPLGKYPGFDEEERALVRLGLLEPEERGAVKNSPESAA
jgi:hypothetical protein